MLLHPATSSHCVHNHHHHLAYLSSALSYSLSFPSRFSSSPFIQTQKNLPIIRCKISQVHNYGTVDFERKPALKWNSIYKRISLMQNPELGVATVLNECEKEGKILSKWELCKVVRQLRKFRRYSLALEVYEWMNNRQERFRITSSDSAIQLDLIAKVHGISHAEDYFVKLPDALKDQRIYGALLNAYVRYKSREKAESLIEQMRNRRYANHALPFNVMMTLYMNFKDYDKVNMMVSEMMENNIQLDIYSYNIWLSSCGSQGSVEKMEQVFEQMKLDRNINPNWTTFSTMATMYIKLGQLEKAEDSLRKVESRITGRDRIPYHYLITLYGSVGNKEEAYRVWNIYKSIFPFITNLGYHTMISSLVRVGDIDGAEKLYEEWLSGRSAYDPRIGNLLMNWYVRNGLPEKAEAFYNQMIEVGGKPNSSTWEILADGNARRRKLSEALSCLKDAVSADGSKSWKPKPVVVASILKLCEQEDDNSSKAVLFDVLRKVGCLEDEVYMSYISIPNETVSGVDQPREDGRSDDEGADMLLNQLDGSL